MDDEAGVQPDPREDATALRLLEHGKAPEFGRDPCSADPGRTGISLTPVG